MTALLQTAIFGFTINLAAAAISFYFWTENRNERYLLFWALSWGSSVIRWAIHVPAQHDATLLGIEGLIIPVTLLFNALGCYDLLPSKPWRPRTVAWSTATIMFGYTVAATILNRPLEMGYVLFAATLVVNVVCLWAAYRSARLSGYAFTAAVFLYQFVLIVSLLFNLGREIANSIIVPLYNIPILCGIALIAHQRQQRTLVESERTLRTSFESATVGVCLVGTDGRFLNVNRTLSDMLGYAKDELLQLHFNDVTSEEDKGIGRNFLADALSGGPRTTQFEKRYVRKDGGVVWAFVSTALIEQSGNQGSHLITYVQDITERKRATEQLEMLKASVDNHFDAAYWLDTSDRLVYVNDTATKVLGYSREELLGQPLALVAPNATGEILEKIWSHLREGGSFSRQSVHRRKDGSQFPVEIVASYVRHEGKEFNCGFARDITERLKLEEDLRLSAEEMRQLYTRLASVEDDERRALHLELHDQVGANLAALRLELDVAASQTMGDDASSVRRHLATAREVAAETIAMTRDLMAELRPPALDDFGLVAALRAFAETQSVRLAVPIDVTGHDLSPRPSRLVEGALFRIAHEAVMNAARHASASRVVVEVGESGERVQLSVIDNGVGFDPEAPTAGPDHWGLKNMRERARAVGGMLHLTTAPGAGTRITADAPRAAS